MPTPPPTVPPNPARANAAAALARHTTAGAPQPAQRFSDEMIALHAKHAAARATLEAHQWNERLDMQEAHAAEVAELREKETPATAPAK